MKDTATLYLVHHGQTRLDDAPGGERINGWKRIGLAPNGEATATKTGKWLARHAHIGEVYSSSLPRASQTGNRIQEVTGAKRNTLRDNLRSWDVGILTGSHHDEAEPLLADHRTQRWTALPGGESYAKFLARFGQGLDQLIQDALTEDQDCAAVTHSHNLEALPHLLSNGEEPILKESPVGPGGVIAVHIAERGKRLTPETVYNP
jgi:broad specificity phosphatase PhoE